MQTGDGTEQRNGAEVFLTRVQEFTGLDSEVTLGGFNGKECSTVMEKINEIVGIAEEIVGKSLTEYQRACHSGFDAIRTLQRLDLPADAEKRQRVLRKFVDDVELFGSIMKKHYNGIGNPSDEALAVVTLAQHADAKELFADELKEYKSIVKYSLML